ncbi:MAG: hypothetical protein ABI986_14125, partial [Chloroflexota bacterium]
MYPSQRFHEVSNRVTQYIVLGYQIIALIAFVSGLILAYGWLRNPFIGGFFEHTMVLNGSDTHEPNQHWSLYEQGFQLGDQLVSVDGKPISNANDLKKILSTSFVGKTVSIELRTQSGEVKKADIILQSFPAADRIAYFILPTFLGLVFLVVSLWIFGLRRTEPAGRAFSMLTSSLAIVIGSLFDIYTSHTFTRLWILSIGITGGAFIDLALNFPQEIKFVVRRPYLRWIGYLIGMIVSVSTFGTLFNFDNPTAYIAAWSMVYKFTGIAAVIYFVALFYHAFAAYSPIVKSQARTILIGSLIAFGPTVIWILIARQPFNPYLFLPMIVFPLVNGYVIMRFRLLRADYWMRQSLVYAMLTVFVVAAYGLLVSGIALIFSISMPSSNPYLIGGLVFLIAVFLDPVRTRIQVWVDSTFFRGQRAYEDRMRIFSHDLTRALDLNTIGRVLREQIESSLVP